MMKKHVWVYSIIAALVFAGAAILGYEYYKGVSSPPVPAGGSAAPAASYDVTDRRMVAGISSNIFFGTVEEKVGDQGLPLSGPGNESIPMHQYAVSVERNLKGQLPDSVTVN